MKVASGGKCKNCREFYTSVRRRRDHVRPPSPIHDTGGAGPKEEVRGRYATRRDCLAPTLHVRLIVPRSWPAGGPQISFACNKRCSSGGNSASQDSTGELGLRVSWRSDEPRHNAHPRFHATLGDQAQAALYFVFREKSQVTKRGRGREPLEIKSRLLLVAPHARALARATER